MKWLPAMLVALLASLAVPLYAADGPGDDGLVTKPSEFTVSVTADRLEEFVRNEGGTLFARLDLAAEAAKAGEILPPTQAVLFGNMRGGAKFLRSAPASGIDLPQKVLIWDDGHGKVFVTYSTFAWLAKRHKITDRSFLVNMGDDNIDLLTEKVIHK